MIPIDETWRAIAVLALATLGSEDVTCIAAGQLTHAGRIPLAAAIVGCLLGIYIGDLGLWLTGRIFGRWLPSSTPESFARLGAFLHNHGPAAIVAARFLPGSRLPLYVAAGSLGQRPWQFVIWSFIAAVLWTPLIVVLAAFFGESFARPLRSLIGTAWIAGLLAILIAYLLLRATRLVSTEIGRHRIHASLARLWRWEFWPTWLLYLPLVPWIVFLSVRHRGFTTITAANPSIPDGGFVGESKYQILKLLQSPHVIATELIPSAVPRLRLPRLREVIHENGWSFPIILKPDVGERGAGVDLIQNLDHAAHYLLKNPATALVQPYHPGPYEAGIFYYRFPNSPTGQIFSITDKCFSDLIGDGTSTIEQLIWRHPRYRMQVKTFLARHAKDANRVLAKGERFQLAFAGNHCQGTMFRDGAHLITPQLRRKIDEIARTCDGFFFGRFDVRYANVEKFKSGEEFSIIELNGVTSESTNIYDPDRSLVWAYQTLARQWALLFRIGEQNRQLGHACASSRELLRAIVLHWWPARRSLATLRPAKYLGRRDIPQATRNLAPLAHQP